MTSHTQSHTPDMVELNQNPPSFGESQRQDSLNDGDALVSQEVQERPHQGALVEKIEPAEYSVSAPQQNDPLTSVDVIPGEQVQYVTPLENLGEKPEWIDCQFCKRRTQTRVTRVTHEDSSATTLAGFLCCLVCVCFACLPCVMGMCQNTDHYCTECKRKVTHKPHDGPIQVQKTSPSGKQVSVYAYPQGQAQMQYQPQSVQQQQGSVPSNKLPMQGELPHGGTQAVSASLYQSGVQAAPEPAELA